MSHTEDSTRSPNMHDKDVRGRHAVVTGGGSGIGAATAKRLVEHGATVSIMGRDATRLASAAEQMGCTAQQVDITDAQSVSNGFAAVVDQHGPVEILVNNAGAAESCSFAKMDHALWSRMLEVNLTGTFACTRAVIEPMLERSFGRIVNIASTSSLKGFAYVSAYCAAKHGVLGMTRALALEVARKGITVNAVCPGFADTELTERSIENIVASTGRTPEQALAALVKGNPQQRLIQPEEIAGTVLWLCSKSATSVTGQAIAVAGGEVM